MKRIPRIALSVFCFACLFSFGQGKEPCLNTKKGIKSITSFAQESSILSPEKEIDFYNKNGQLIKTEMYYDSMLGIIDTFIYSADEKLLWRKSIDPVTRTTNQYTENLYDSLGVNYCSIVTTLNIDWIDSVKRDTSYHHIRYDFVRNKDNLFTERKTFFGIEKTPIFDTTKFEYTLQKWEADTAVYIEDNYSGLNEYLKKHFRDCKLIKTDFFDEKGDITSIYEYKYMNIDAQGNWLTQEIYLTEKGERKLVNRYTREIVLY